MLRHYLSSIPIRVIALAMLIAPASGCGSGGDAQSGASSTSPATSPSVAGSKPGTPSATTATHAAPADRGDDAYTSASGKFSARFPGSAPEEKAEQEKGVLWHTVSAKVGMYFVSYADFPNAAKAKAAQDDYVAHMSQEFKERREVTIEGQRGLEVAMDVSKTSTLWVRLLVVGNRFFKIAAANKNNAHDKTVSFLDSFKLLKGGGDSTEGRYCEKMRALYGDVQHDCEDDAVPEIKKDCKAPEAVFNCVLDAANKNAADKCYTEKCERKR